MLSLMGPECDCRKTVDELDPSSRSILEEEANWPWVWVLRDPKIMNPMPEMTDDEKDKMMHDQKVALVEILPHLFISSFKVAADFERLKERGITHVLNCAGKGARAQGAKEAGFTYKEIDGQDGDGYAMLQHHLRDSRKFVASASATSGKCLIYCGVGFNRSGVLVAAERMLALREPVLDTVRHCREARGTRFLCNASFQADLVALARREGLLGAAPGQPGCRVRETPGPFVSDKKPPRP